MITHRVRHLCLANVLLALVSPVPAVFAQGSLDHLLCRRVTDSLRVDATADLLASQPAYTALGCRISRTSKLCVPVSKTNVSPPPPSAIAGPTLDGAYICYHLKCRVSSTTDVLEDQFGSHQLKTVRGVSEVCVPTGTPTTTTVTETTTTTGMGTTTTLPCGSSGQPCCEGNSCQGGLACSGGTCGYCGLLGGPCCPGGGCISSPQDHCVGGMCVPACGFTGQPCCFGTECYSGTVCSGGTCIPS